MLQDSSLLQIATLDLLNEKLRRAPSIAKKENYLDRYMRKSPRLSTYRAFFYGHLLVFSQNAFFKSLYPQTIPKI
jgi:hypothetical protein